VLSSLVRCRSLGDLPSARPRRAVHHPKAAPSAGSSRAAGRPPRTGEKLGPAGAAGFQSPPV